MGVVVVPVVLPVVVGDVMGDGSIVAGAVSIVCRGHLAAIVADMIPVGREQLTSTVASSPDIPVAR